MDIFQLGDGGFIKWEQVLLVREAVFSTNKQINGNYVITLLSPGSFKLLPPPYMKSEFVTFFNLICFDIPILTILPHTNNTTPY